METLLLAYFFYHFGLPDTYNPHTSVLQSSGNTSVLQVEQYRSGVQKFLAGTQRVPLLDLQFSASCEADIEVSSIEVTHRGLGAVEDIDGVYVVEGTRRLNTARQLQRSGKATMHLRNFIIPACESVTVIVAADISADASIASEHWLEVSSATDIRTKAFVSLKPIMSTSKTTPYTVGGNTTGAIQVSYPTLNTRVRYGTNQSIGRISLKADNTASQVVRAITFTNNGSATNSDLQNIYLQASGNKVVTRTVLKLDGDVVRLEFSPPLLLRKNQQRLFTVKADLKASRSRTIKLIVEEPSDIEVTSSRQR